MSEPTPTDATKVDQIEARVRGAFLELALTVGGIVAEHPTRDPVVFAISRSVEKAYRSCMAPLADLRESGADEPKPTVINLRRHPAILHLLSVIETKSRHELKH
ncbi:MAG: hypothetical protein Q8O14_07705 [bacterium]|nr:hypothetical protein [bacterium]